MRTSVVCLALFLLGCEPAATESCDVHDFLKSFHPTRGAALECRRVYSETESLSQSFTTWTDGKTAVTYWANSIPVRIIGEAPPCLLERYREEVPRAPMRIEDCTNELITTP